MEQNLLIKAKPMHKEEVMCLLNLIGQHNIITTKATNASNNKLKDEAWKTITQEHNALTAELRRPEQLRLKWENLKKCARKREALIRQNNMKTGGGKSFVQPDEALDRVAAILGATCSGYTVPFGGDAEAAEESTEYYLSFKPVENTLLDANEMNIPVDPSSSQDPRGGVEEPTPRKFVFKQSSKQNITKRAKLRDQVLQAQKQREDAMTAYYTIKAEKIKLEIENLKKANGV